MDVSQSSLFMTLSQRFQASFCTVFGTVFLWYRWSTVYGEGSGSSLGLRYVKKRIDMFMFRGLVLYTAIVIFHI